VRKRSALDRDLIAEAIRSTVDDEVREHFNSLTQEHQLTSRICGALEARLRYGGFGRYNVQIILQEIPDKGPGTLEKRTGVDLYIGIRMDEGPKISKGLFIQAKWNEHGRSRKEQADLVAQCKKIDEKTDAGYLWLYGPNGVDIVPAKEVVANPHVSPERLGSRKVNEVMRQVFDCFEGDRRFGPPSGPSARAGLGVLLEEFAAENAIIIDVTNREIGDLLE
jgi:hypothetical protein